MNKKKILFVMNGMVCGGVERAFLSSLSLIDPARFDVTCVLMRRYGALLDEIPQWVNTFEFPFSKMDRYEFNNGRKPALIHALKTGHIVSALEMLFFRFGSRLFKRKIPFNYLRRSRMAARARRNIPAGLLGGYDVLLAYGGMEMVSIASRLFQAKRRYVWFHLESQPKFESVFYFDALYKEFDGRYCCSRKLADKLNDFYDPESRSFEFFPYYLNPELYKTLAKAVSGFTDDFKGVRILSVGRLDEQKGFDLAIDACLKLKAAGRNVRWYVIGEGDERSKLEKAIAEKNLSDDFVLLGLKTNPYPYFEQCDLYVQPSRWEGYCLTVAEARVFNRPIVCTDFAGAREQIKDGETGIIVPEISSEAVFSAVSRILDDESLGNSFVEKLGLEQIDNEKSVRKRWLEMLAD